MFHVRAATIDDLDVLTNLRVTFLEQLGDLTDEYHREAFRGATYAYLREALPAGKFLAWVAEFEERIVGTSGLVLFEQAPTPSNLSGVEAYILNMYTLPEWRGRGIAQALLREIIAYAHSKQVPYLWLYATKAGRPVYEKLGFTLLTDAMGLFLGERDEQTIPQSSTYFD